MGLPEFSCTGQIISSQTTTAAAYWYYNLEELPVIRIPDGGEFTPDMLPSKLLALINRDNGESEEEVPVIWDENTFPSEQKRALVQGSFADGYTQYGDSAPRCLVVWESEENPFFLNVYLEQATEWYDMVFLYGETPQAGTVSLQSSDDGETWRELTDTDGYEPITAGPKEALMWMLSYSHADSGTERPRYYRMVLLLEDGTECYSEALELTDDFFFTAADIEGGRGGETSPNQGDDLLPENGLWGSGVAEEETPSGSDTSPEEQPDQEPFEEPADAR